MKKQILLLLILIASTFAYKIPANPHRVNDIANVLSPETEQRITEYLKAIEEKNGSQIVVLTIPSLNGKSIEEFSLDVAEKWKLGQKDVDNGVLITLAVKDRKLRIEVGYGLEGALTDAKSSYIIRNIMVPQLRAGNYDAAIANGVQAVGGIVLGEFDITPQQIKKSQKQNSSGSGFFVIIVIFFIIIRFLPFFIVNPTGWFLLDMLVDLGRAASRGSSGGGGFGGFSGGGGGFGGGGSSGSW